MATEIERKFLVKGDSWRSLAVGSPYRQGYIATSGKSTVRVRIAGDKGYLTLKGPSTNSFYRKDEVQNRMGRCRLGG
jgi:adenylate cyclase